MEAFTAQQIRHGSKWKEYNLWEHVIHLLTLAVNLSPTGTDKALYLINSHVYVMYRFLRHVPVIYVDYPGPHSLNQIYGTFNRAMLRLVPNLRAYSDPLTEAMVEFYTKSQVIIEIHVWILYEKGNN